MMRRCALLTVFLVIVLFQQGAAGDSPFADIIKDKIRIMIVVADTGSAGDFVGYAENLLKKGFKKKGAAIFNPEMMKKVKEDKLLWQAIQNGSATAMAKIATDYGAVILVRGALSVDTRQKFAASWEGSASLSLTAVDTRTAEEIVNVNSDPFGSTQNPSPIEDSPLVAKQVAVQRVCNSVLVKAGILSSTSNIEGASTTSFELYEIFDIPAQGAASLVFSKDSRMLYVAAGDGIHGWDLLERKDVHIMHGGDGTPRVLAVSPDGSLLAAGDDSGNVQLWEMESGGLKSVIPADAGSVQAIAFRPDGGTIAISNDDEEIYLVSLAAGKVTAELEGHDDLVNSLAFTPNGQHLVSAGNDLSIRWWDVNVRKEKKALTESTDKLLCMALSSDGTLVALSTVDVYIDLARNSRRDERRIKVRNTVTGEEVRTLEGHEKDITTLDFHPDKRFLASGSIDDTIRVWDIQKGEMVNLLELNGDLVKVKFSDDGKWFGAVSNDGKLSVWKLR